MSLAYEPSSEPLHDLEIDDASRVGEEAGADAGLLCITLIVVVVANAVAHAILFWGVDFRPWNQFFRPRNQFLSR